MSEKNLQVLASFYERPANFGTAGDKLSITAQGTFERVSGIKGSFSRTFNKLDQSFLSERIQTIINQNFNQELNTISEQSKINDALLVKFSLILKAYKGYASLRTAYEGNERYFGSRKIESIADKNLKQIRSKMIEVLTSEKNILIKFEENQNTFLANMESSEDNSAGNIIDFVNGGICWGIAAKWCLRWLKGKEGFNASKHTFAPIFSDEWNHRPDEGVRFQKKSTEMFTLMHNQNTIGKMGGQLRLFGGSASEAMTPFSAANYKTQEFKNITTGGKEKYTYRGAANTIHEQRNTLSSGPKETYENYITRKSADHANINMAPRAWFFLNRINPKDKILCPKDVMLEDAINDLLDDIRPFTSINKVAFIVTWLADDGGHAMSIAYSLNDKEWYFMDPNFGEWRGTYDFIKSVILLLYSRYSITNNIIRVSQQRFYLTP